jgi:AAA+ superfamily predicted ATPase
LPTTGRRDHGAAGTPASQEGAGGEPASIPLPRDHSLSRRTEVTTPEEIAEDQGSEPGLRPQRLAEFIGQEKVREALGIAVEAARQRREPLDHVLFHGPPGLGKTTLAALMARELGVNIKVTSGPVLRSGSRRDRARRR